MLKQKDQSGMASFLVVSIIVTLLALISFGFSHLADRELRQSLDRELSDQAYYAADSGLNDARSFIASAAGQTYSSTSCSPPTNSPYFVDDLSGGLGVAKYPCVLMTANPKQLVFDVYPDRPISIAVNMSGLKKFYFSWQNKTYAVGPQALNYTTPSKIYLPSEHGLNADATGLLRVGIYPARNGDSNSRLSSNGRNFFMYPNSGNGSVTSVNFNSGGFVKGNCKTGTTNPAYCNTAVDLNSGYSTYYISLSANYAPLSVIIRAATNAGIVGVPGVEGSIDVTGSGSDVLRRIAAYVPLNLNSSIPGYSLQSMQAVCKLFRVTVTQPSQYNSSFLAANPNSACFTVNGNSNDKIDNSGLPPPL